MPKKLLQTFSNGMCCLKICRSYGHFYFTFAMSDHFITKFCELIFFTYVDFLWFTWYVYVYLCY